MLIIEFLFNKSTGNDTTWPLPIPNAEAAYNFGFDIHDQLGSFRNQVPGGKMTVLVINKTISGTISWNLDLKFPVFQEYRVVEVGKFKYC